MKKNFEEDAWDELRDFYGDDLRLSEDEYKEAQYEASIYDDNPEFSDKNKLVMPGEKPIYLDNFVIEGTRADGTVEKLELLGRFDFDGKTYLALHPMSDETGKSYCFVGAHDDENGQLAFEDITDNETLEMLEEEFYKLMTDDPNAVDIENGGVQWND